MIRSSRQWIKERIPAFICKETGFWVTRWIQCNVFVCPECRKEYRSLKGVWNQLDEWEVDEPHEETEEAFLQMFQEKYPGAYDDDVVVTQSSIDWVPRLAYAGAGMVLALTVLVLQDPGRINSPQNVVLTEIEDSDSGSKEALADSSSSENKNSPTTPQSQLASSPSIEAQTGKQEETTLFRNQNRPSQRSLINGGQVRLTSTVPMVNSRFPKSLSHMKRTVEVNRMPVTGFESLAVPYDEDRPF